MKSLVVAFYFSILLTPAYAQKNHVPLSEAQRYIEANGEPVAGLYECKDKPSEPCLDFSSCESWEVCEIAEVAGQKYLKTNASKKSAKDQAEKDKKDKKKLDKEEKENIKKELKDLVKDASKIKTVADVKDVLLKIIKAIED